MCLALNGNQSEDKSSESNKSLNKVQNVLAYFGKQSKKLITKVKTQIKKNITRKHRNYADMSR